MNIEEGMNLIVTFHENGRQQDYAVRTFQRLRGNVFRCIPTHVPTPYEYVTFPPRTKQDIDLSRIGYDGLVRVSRAPWSDGLKFDDAPPRELFHQQQ